MTRIRLVALALGLPFGFVLSWSGMTYPDEIRRMLLLEDAYFYLVMASSTAVAFAGLRIARARGLRTLTGERVSWTVGRPERRHVGGSVLFGAGWAISLSCPGPIAAQLGQGLPWSLCTIAGIAGGILVHAAWTRRARPAAAAVPATR